MNEEKKFIKPACEVVEFYAEDIITVSDPSFPGNIDTGHTDDTPFI